MTLMDSNTDGSAPVLLLRFLPLLCFRTLMMMEIMGWSVRGDCFLGRTIRKEHPLADEILIDASHAWEGSLWI